MHILKNIFAWLRSHKIISAIIIIATIAVGYYFYRASQNNSGESLYVLAKVEKGAIIASVSGTGQVSSLDQTDVKAKVSGDVVYVGVSVGQEVSAGTLIAKIDETDALKTIGDAEDSLRSSQISYEKLVGQDKSSPRNVQDAQDNLKKSYDSGFNSVSNTFLNLPTIITGVHDILFNATISKIQQNIDYYTGYAKTYDDSASEYKNSAYDSYNTARSAYDVNFESYKAASRFSDEATVESLIGQTYDTTKDIAEVIKNANDLIQFYKDKLAEHSLTPNSAADAHLASLGSYLSQVNSSLSSLLSAKTSIQSNKDAFVNAALDIDSQELILKQKEASLTNAKESLNNCYIRAPYNGVIAKLNIRKGDSVSSGTSVATIITKQQIAEISFNEVDAADVEVGQKATLTFDAIDELSIAGEVSEIDTVGTVSQGVVNYNVTIRFLTQNNRIKPGMSVSASIISETKQDVLLVSSSAVKSLNGANYIEMPVDSVAANDIKASGVALKNGVRRQAVETGLSDDSNVEIISGLNEGDIIVSRTIVSSSSSSSSSNSSSSQNRSIFQSIGGGGPGR